jgi:hypothetical protein
MANPVCKPQQTRPGIHETPHGRRTRELLTAIAEWRASTGAEHIRDRHHAMRLLRVNRLLRNAERSEVARKARLNVLRKSAANMRLIASSFDISADQATDQREIIAWDLAMSAVEDAAAALEHGADSIEGVWREDVAA